MKNNIGTDKTKFARDLKNICLANDLASTGIAAPCVLSSVQRISFLVNRQITPQTLSIIIHPIPPPMPIEINRLLSQP
jgi:hypothetical protein